MSITANQTTKPTPDDLTAPSRVDGAAKPWLGTITRKPQEYAVQVVIPHLDTPEPVELAVELWRAQTLRPYITIIDTGSTGEHRERIAALQADDVEIHYLRCHGYQHASQPVSIAQDVALALCQQTLQFNTHSDVFPRRRDLLEWYAGQCSASTPAVGYEISPRDHVRDGWLRRNWQGMLGHTATMIHTPTIKRLGISWDYQRAMDQVELNPDNPGDFDTEVGFGLLLRQAGILPTIVGHDINRKRQVDEHIDHVRSHSSSKLLDPRYHTGNCSRWMALAMSEGRARLDEWSRSA
uniref:Uncharacterized protein n=1 Tax=uncultured marine virus TaxID=186617 RepID=A0A0F7L7A4_9VIRU|nr:hypothetical protein [uncultured marine virus]